MRVLLDQECAAVAGGHESECEQTLTSVTIAAGAVVGAIVGSGAGGAGALPGALAGGTAGSLLAEVAVPAVCRALEDKESEEKEEKEEKETDGPSGSTTRSGSNPFAGADGTIQSGTTAPHQLVIAQSATHF